MSMGSGPTIKAPNHREQILALLQERGVRGIANDELNRICFRYGARIYELRKQGYLIETVRFGEGLFRFVYRGKRGASESVQIGLFAEAT